MDRPSTRTPHELLAFRAPAAPDPTPPHSLIEGDWGRERRGRDGSWVRSAGGRASGRQDWGTGDLIY